MQYTTTSVNLVPIKDHRNVIEKYMYECVMYPKGFPNKVLFKSGLNTTRDGAVQEVLQFLRKFPQYINEWVN